MACVGGGCNAIGLFTAFLDDDEVAMFGVEPSGTDIGTVGKHAATMTLGTPGTIHGFKCYLLQDEKGEPAAVNTVASGLDYPGSGSAALFSQRLGKGDVRDGVRRGVRGRVHDAQQGPGDHPRARVRARVAFGDEARGEEARGADIVNLSGRATRTSTTLRTTSAPNTASR